LKEIIEKVKTYKNNGGNKVSIEEEIGALIKSEDEDDKGEHKEGK
jgi:hypothetical protein